MLGVVVIIISTTKYNNTSQNKKDQYTIEFSLNWPTGPNQFLSCDVRVSVCLSEPSWKTCFPVDWRLLVVERIANIGIPLDFFFNDFISLAIFRGFGVFSNQPNAYYPVVGTTSRKGATSFEASSW